MTDLDQVDGWLRERFPHHPHIYFGVSGSTLLYEALKTQERRSVVLPAFLCPSLSAMAVRAGKCVAHIDSDRRTLHPDIEQLESHLAGQDPSDSVVLIDHSFGHPFPGLAGLGQKFPKLLIIEDCARALGVRICGGFPGEYADWVLLSMYKTIPGSGNGGILLTRTPLPLKDGPRVSATIRERASTMAPLRYVYDLLQRARADFGPRRAHPAPPEWEPAYGFPSKLCMARFAAELSQFEQRDVMRRTIAGELADSLSRLAGIECSPEAPGCQSAGHFVSFRILNRGARDPILAKLQRKGLFLFRTWDVLPVHYACFRETFPSGHANSEYLADHIAHIPVRLFPKSEQRRRLVATLRDLVDGRPFS